MKNEFSAKLKEMRGKKFPGQSLRRVGELLSSSANLGDYFFTQLSKMESGLLLPSSNLLLKITDAYKLNVKEKEEIFLAYFVSVTWKKINQIDKVSNKNLRNKIVHKLYRKTKDKEKL